jgi:adenine-specific DNA-methyltransferase
LAIADPNAIDHELDRKNRGAFFTPPAIADYLVRWAVRDPAVRVLDPTCGDGSFLRAAGARLRSLGASDVELEDLVFGVDLHPPALEEASQVLTSETLDATLVHSDFFALTPPGQLFPSLPDFDAVVGNPPFIRYQQHTGESRRRSIQAAQRQGVHLTGLASSWAAILVHASAFLNRGGRLAMVVPAELLSVGYADPIRRWLTSRFGAVKLVVFERLQFSDAIENVVLLLAEGSGGCDAFSIHHVETADDLWNIQPMDGHAVALPSESKWNDLLLSSSDRQLFRRVVDTSYVELRQLGQPTLGTVTGANSYFALPESTRVSYGLRPGRDVVPVCPPGTRHLQGLVFTRADWRRLKEAGSPVWLLVPGAAELREPSDGLQAYFAEGVRQGIPSRYKCQVRSDWRRPPAVRAPDLFFTYMSHRFPRLIRNHAATTFLNTMHGLRLDDHVPRTILAALPLVALNSVTLLGAELGGRSYGGGILKMEPSEAGSLPVPSETVVLEAWAILARERIALARLMRQGLWTTVLARVDEVVLGEVLNLPASEAEALHRAALVLRGRRLVRGSAGGAEG